LDIEQLFEFYKPKNRSKLLKGAKGMIEALDIDEMEKAKYNEWLELCLTRRIELNSLTAQREIENYKINKARDFVDSIIKKTEMCTWDLNRYRKPRMHETGYVSIDVKKPSYIIEIIDEIKEKATEKVYKYLESNNLRWNSDWEGLVKEDYDKMGSGRKSVYEIHKRLGGIKMKRIHRANKRYEGSLLSIDNIISDQNSELYRVYRAQGNRRTRIRENQKRVLMKLVGRTPEYGKVKAGLEGIRDVVIEALDNIDIGGENDNDK